MPGVSAVGMNTEISTSPIAISAPDTSRIVLCAASRGDRPLRTWFSTASTTTMASSTTIPTASTSAKRDRELIENPSASWTANVPTRATGIAMIGMMAARQVCKKTMITSTTRTIASSRVDWTALTEAATNSVGLYGVA